MTPLFHVPSRVTNTNIVTARKDAVGAKQYEWHTYTGNARKMKNGGAEYVLAKNDVFGVRVKDTNTNKLVIMKHGLDRVFTLSEKDMMAVSKRSVPADTDMIDTNLMNVDAAYKIWITVRRQIASKQLCPKDGMHEAIARKVYQYQRHLFEGKSVDSLAAIRMVSKYIKENYEDIDLETEDDNKEATKFIRAMDCYSEGSSFSLWADVLACLRAAFIVKAVAAKEVTTAKKQMAKWFGKTELSENIPSNWNAVMRKYAAGEPVVEELSDGNVEVRPQAAPASTPDADSTTDSTRLRGRPSALFQALVTSFNNYSKTFNTMVSVQAYNAFIEQCVIELNGQLTANDKVRLDKEYAKYANAYAGKTNTVSGNLAENKAAAKADKVQITPEQAEAMLGEGISLDTAKTLLKTKVKQAPVVENVVQTAEAQPKDYSGLVERLKSSISADIKWTRKLEKIAVEMFTSGKRMATVVKAINAQFAAAAPAEVVTKKPRKQKVDTGDVVADAEATPSVAQDAATDDASEGKGRGKPRMSFTDFVENCAKRSGRKIDKRNKALIGQLREAYDANKDTFRTCRDLKLVPRGTGGTVREGNEPKSVLDPATASFMQKVEDKSGIEVDEDVDVASIVVQVMDGGGTVNQAVEALLGPQEGAAAAPATPKVRKLRTPRPAAMPVPADQVPETDPTAALDALNSLVLDDVPAPLTRTRKQRAPKPESVGMNSLLGGGGDAASALDALNSLVLDGGEPPLNSLSDSMKKVRKPRTPKPAAGFATPTTPAEPEVDTLAPTPAVRVGDQTLNFGLIEKAQPRYSVESDYEGAYVWDSELEQEVERYDFDNYDEPSEAKSDARNAEYQLEEEHHAQLSAMSEAYGRLFDLGYGVTLKAFVGKDHQGLRYKYPVLYADLNNTGKLEEVDPSEYDKVSKMSPNGVAPKTRKPRSPKQAFTADIPVTDTTTTTTPVAAPKFSARQGFKRLSQPSGFGSGAVDATDAF